MGPLGGGNYLTEKKPELLAPAGDWPSLIAAVENGADSVYFGVKGLNMRQMAGNFEATELDKVMDRLRQSGKKGFLALNTIVMNDELGKVRKILRQAQKARVDAVILWDMSVLSAAKELGLPVHISTQASVSNIEALKLYVSLGAKRVVLARECTLSQIIEMTEAIKQQNIGCEIETFIHGAMCLSISGRCFMSKYTHNQSANRGECTQPCRREYEIRSTDGDEEFIVGDDYVLSPKDLCAVEFLDELIEAGIDSFKIEGRMRSPEYARVTTGAYRQAIDAYFSGRLNAGLKKELKQRLGIVYNRGFSDGFYFGAPKDACSRHLEHTREKVYIGEVKRYYQKIRVADILVRAGTLKKGQEIMVIGKKTPSCTAVIEELQQNNAFVGEVAKGEHAGVKLPFKVNPTDKVFLWRRKL
jgi:putative protease